MTPEERMADWQSREEKKNGDSGLYHCARMSKVEPKVVEWLWKPYLPIGKVTLLDGWPGIGKSYITCKLAAIVSQGGGFPNGYAFEPGNVLMFNAEDGLADTLRPRLEACGADLSKVYCLDILHKDGIATFDQAGLLRFESTIMEYDPRFVIVDPLFAFTGAGVDIHRANESRAVSSRLAAIAAKYALSMLCVRHLNKGGGGGSTMRAGIGSIDWIAAARVGLLAGCDPDDESKMALTNYKNNLAKKGEPLGYRIDFNPEADQGEFIWTGTSDLTADRILAPHTHEDAGESAQRADAKDFLYNLLLQGRLESGEVWRSASQAGISERALKDAKIGLGIKPYKEGGECGRRGAKWYWELNPGWILTQEGQEDQKQTQHGQIVEDVFLGSKTSDKSSYDSNLSQERQDKTSDHVGSEEMPDPRLLWDDPEPPDEDFDPTLDAIDS